jgi:hypothetical protein
MATWLGWMIEWGTPVTVVGESGEQVAAAQREPAASAPTPRPAPPPGSRTDSRRLGRSASASSRCGSITGTATAAISPPTARPGRLGVRITAVLETHVHNDDKRLLGRMFCCLSHSPLLTRSAA